MLVWLCWCWMVKTGGKGFILTMALCSCCCTIGWIVWHQQTQMTCKALRVHFPHPGWNIIYRRLHPQRPQKWSSCSATVMRAGSIVAVSQGWNWGGGENLKSCVFALKLAPALACNLMFPFMDLGLFLYLTHLVGPLCKQPIILMTS